MFLFKTKSYIFYDLMVYTYLFMMSMVLLIMFFKYMLVMLMILEVMILNVSLIMFMVFSMLKFEFYLIYYLVFSVCESVLGMALLVLIVRFSGNDLYYSFSMSKF